MDKKNNSIIIFKKNITKREKKNINNFANTLHTQNLVNQEKNYLHSDRLIQKYKFYENFNIGVGNFSEEQKQKLSQEINIEEIRENKKVKALSIERIDKEQINKSIPRNWGINKVGVLDYPKSGKGVKVAILDTGWDFNHEDFKDRNIITHTLVGNKADDGNGHGMHCAGIACGYKDISGENERYGIAYESDIYICKVLDDNGLGWQDDVISGINWAIEQKCQVISLSLGTENSNYLTSDPAYNRIFEIARENNCLVVAGVGNDSNRNSDPKKIVPIVSPSDSTYCWGVNSIDYNSNIYYTANRADLDLEQSIKFAAPGVQIFSSLSITATGESHGYMTGTSMATPHMAGIIALLWEGNLDKDVTHIIKLLRLYFKHKEESLNENDYGDGIINLLLT